MDSTLLRIMELDYHGYYCSQILMILALESQGKTNPDLIRAMGGLAHGHGFERGTCGSLTGAACFLGLYAGKGSDDEYEDENLKHMLKDLGDWFDLNFGSRYGDVTCKAIVGYRVQIKQICGEVIARTYGKLLELLNASGYDVSVGR